LADLLRPRFALRPLLLLADFLPLDLRPADFLAEDILAPPFLAAFFRGRAVRERDAGSSPSSNEDEEGELGLEEGLLSIGSGSIHPEPDQPISI
jgi:hypothetical protein